jgi:hypothetical protein
MVEAYIVAFLEQLPEMDRGSCFNPFHSAGSCGKALDVV